jgi:hypothetical protein
MALFLWKQTEIFSARESKWLLIVDFVFTSEILCVVTTLLNGSRTGAVNSSVGKRSLMAEEMAVCEAHDSPLIDVVMSLVTKAQPSPLDPQDSAKVRAAIRGLLNGMPFLACENVCTPILQNIRALDRNQTILSVPEQPVPEAMESANRRTIYSKRRPQPWTSNEDNRLLLAVHRFGLHAWPAVADFVGNGRSRAQCAQRWTRGLDPRLSKGEWSREEDRKLINLVMCHGLQGWTYISREMGNRSDVQCRYHYLQLNKLNKEFCFPFLPVIPRGQFACMRGPALAGMSGISVSELTKGKKGRPLTKSLPVCAVSSANPSAQHIYDAKNFSSGGPVREDLLNQDGRKNDRIGQHQAGRTDESSLIEWNTDVNDGFLIWD